MKKYIKSSSLMNKELFEDTYIPELIDNGYITSDEVQACLNIDYEDLTEEDAELFISSMANLNYRPSQIRKVSYDGMDEASDKGYDGGYEVTFTDGSTQVFGWRDNDTLRGDARLYPLDNDIESATDTSGATVLEVEFEPYERYGSQGIKKLRAKGADLYQALCNMCDKMTLYLDSEQIQEEEMTPDDIIESIDSSNGDGCDYIFYIKNISTGEMLLQGDYTEDEFYDDEEDYEEHGLV